MDTVKFDKSASEKILFYFDKSVDKEGYIVDNKTHERVIAFDGTQVTLTNFGGIMMGSEIFIKSDLDSIIKFIDRSA